MKKHRFIGGFFQMALPDVHVQRSIAVHWGLPDDPALQFANARSALAALITVLKPKRAWVPAYVCSSVVDAFAANNVQIFYYPVGDTLEPDVSQLVHEACSGDVVLSVNYFGRLPNEVFLDFVRKHKDLIFIEDSAQTIDSGQAPWGHWRLISPRKVVGVADGGYIIPTMQTLKCLLTPSVSRSTETDRWLAPLLRLEDREELNSSRWHIAHQQREKSMMVSDARMSCLSHELLKRMDSLTIIEQRKHNYSVLYELLSHIAFRPMLSPEFCPFGFPIRLPTNLRAVLKDEMIKMGLFPAIHWETLPSPADQFAIEHSLAQELLTIPCDHRYNTTEMEYLGQSVLTILRKYT